MPGLAGQPGWLARSMRDQDPWLKVLIILLVVIAGTHLASQAWLLVETLADILLLFFLAWLIAFVLEPVVTLIDRNTRLPRALGVASVYLALFLVISVAMVLGVPPLAAQVAALNQDLPTYANGLAQQLSGIQQDLAARGVDLQLSTVLGYQEIARRAEALGPALLSNVVAVATSLAALLGRILLVIILSFYMTLDSQRIAHLSVQCIPGRYRDDAAYFMSSVQRAFGGFLRGQILQAAIYGVGTAIVMSAAQLNFVLLASVFAGLVMVVPFIGPIIAILPPAAITLFTHPESFWITVVALVVLQLIVVNVLGPRLMSQAIGMHPLLVFFSFLVGAKIAGLWGAVFGVPIAGVILAMFSFYRMTVEERRAHFQRPEQETPTPEQLTILLEGQQPGDTVAAAAEPSLSRGTPRG